MSVKSVGDASIITVNHKSVGEAMGGNWHVRDGDEEYGPFSLDEMAKCVREKRVLPGTLVRAESESNWRSAGSTEALNEIFPAWYCNDGEFIYGPFSSRDIKSFCQAGKIISTTSIRHGTHDGWTKAGHAGWLTDSLAARPAPVPPSQVKKADTERKQAPDAHEVSLPNKTENEIAEWLSSEEPSQPPLRPIRIEKSAQNIYTSPISAPHPPITGIAVVQSPSVKSPPLSEIRKELQTTMTKPCPFCGETILRVAKKCKHCGEFLEGQDAKTGESDKRILPLFLLFFFFGYFGVHAFYAGRKGWGFFYLIGPVLIGLGILALVPLIGSACFAIGVAFGLIWAISFLTDFICIVAGLYKDGNGRRITKWT
ncbi:MAG: GYF domain-containing protein [Planctomycetota bacterium]